jgi:hypothetical protein
MTTAPAPVPRHTAHPRDERRAGHARSRPRPARAFAGLVLAAAAIGGRAEAACTVELKDDFESGTIAAWPRIATAAPVVVDMGAIAGRRSLAARLGMPNGVGTTVAAATSVSVELKLDLGAVATTSDVPQMVAFESSSGRERRGGPGLALAAGPGAATLVLRRRKRGQPW